MAQRQRANQPDETEAQGNLPDGSSQEDQSLTSQAVALTASIGEIQGRQAQDMQTFVQWLVDSAQTTDEDQYAIMASIVSEIMNATSVEEAMAERSALHAKDILNVPLLLHSFEIREGTYEDSQTGHYAAMHCSRQGSDKMRVVTCGGMKVLAKLYKLQQLDGLPVAFWFTGKETSRGNTVLDIVTPAV